MTFRSMLPLLLVSAFVSMTAPPPAHATACRDWNRMSEQRQRDHVYQLIDDALASNRGRSYRINRNAIGRCLEDHAEDMFYDFTDLCSEGTTASGKAISTRFRQYIWTCVN
jgi:hypothetical protein